MTTSTPICALTNGQAYCGVGDTLARTSGMTLSSSARLNKGSRNTATVVVISHLYPAAAATKIARRWCQGVPRLVAGNPSANQFRAETVPKSPTNRRHGKYPLPENSAIARLTFQEAGAGNIMG